MAKGMMKFPSGKFPEQNRWLSMDDYVRFVNFNLQCFGKRKISKKDELAMHVNVPFSIK